MKAATKEPAIEIKGLTKSFGNNLALGGIDLEVEPGKTLAIFGPNGAGKTTLIKILATIMKPSAGEVYIGGLDLRQNAEDIRSRIGVVCHQTFLYSNLTAYENLHFYCRMYDVADFKQRIHQVVSMVAMKARLYLGLKILLDHCLGDPVRNSWNPEITYSSPGLGYTYSSYRLGEVRSR